jgi:hypothetical protein
VAGFQRLPHHRDVAGAVERIVGAAAEAEHDRLGTLLDLRGVVTAPMPVVTPQPM